MSAKPKRAAAKKSAMPRKTEAAPATGTKPTNRNKPRIRCATEAAGNAIMATGRTVRALSVFVAVSAWLLPSLLMNVWPHASKLLHGEATGAVLGMTVLLTASVIGMPVALFAVEKYRSLVVITAALVMIPALFALNLSNAIECATDARAATSSGPLKVQVEAQALRSRIKTASETRTRIPAFTSTGAGGVKAAQDAVDALTSSKNVECVKRGVRCTAIESKLTDAQEKLGRVLAQREFTVKADKLDSDLDAWQSQLDALGPIPEHADNLAAALSRLFGVSEAWISENFPTLIGMIVEALALFMPVLALAIVTGPAQPASKRRRSVQERGADTADTSKASAQKSGTDPSLVKSAPEVPALVPAEANSRTTALTFIETRLEYSKGSNERGGDIRAAYIAYCLENRLEQVAANVFGSLLAAKYDKGPDKNRPIYLHVRIKSASNVVAIRAQR